MTGLAPDQGEARLPPGQPWELELANIGTGPPGLAMHGFSQYQRSGGGTRDSSPMYPGTCWTLQLRLVATARPSSTCSSSTGPTGLVSICPALKRAATSTEARSGGPGSARPQCQPGPSAPAIPGSGQPAYWPAPGRCPAADGASYSLQGHGWAAVWSAARAGECCGCPPWPALRLSGGAVPIPVPSLPFPSLPSGQDPASSPAGSSSRRGINMCGAVCLNGRRRWFQNRAGLVDDHSPESCQGRPGRQVVVTA
jgi:hypothetical protein